MVLDSSSVFVDLDIQGFSSVLGLGRFFWTFELKWFFQGRVSGFFKGLVLLVVSRIRIPGLGFSGLLDFKELLVFERIKKKGS